MLKTILIAVAMVSAVGVAVQPAVAEKPAVYTGFASNLAVGGYDPVAYFKSGAPQKGEAAFEYDYMGTKWRFANAANLAAFKASPKSFAPQYGGYCAWAAAQGYTAKGDPKNWRIVDGKLYLNFNDEIQAKWEKDIPGFIAKGDKNWPGILK